MADFRTKLRQLESAILKAAKEATSTREMKKIADAAAEEIKLRTRLGYGVSESGQPRQRLASLAPATIENRRLAKIKGSLSGLTTPAKSNLTETGQMLDSLKGSSTQDGKAMVRLTGTRKNSTLTNEKLGEYHQNGTSRMPARPFMGLTNLQIERITDQLRQDIIKRVNQALTKIR